LPDFRFQAGDDAALAAALLRLFSMPEPNRATIGRRGRDWVLGHFNPAIVAEQTLRLYGEISEQSRQRTATDKSHARQN
jgi:glycosyltransferase involved in cell wall biosynthesis